VPTRPGEALPADYSQFLEEVERAVSTAGSRAALTVSAAVLAASWEIGTGIIARVSREGWGAKVIERLAADLRREFPDMRGLSARNLYYMREFARVWPAQSASETLQQPAAKLPWGHHMVLRSAATRRRALEKCSREMPRAFQTCCVLKRRVCRTFPGAGGGTRTPDTRIMIPSRLPELALLSGYRAKKSGLFAGGPGPLGKSWGNPGPRFATRWPL